MSQDNVTLVNLIINSQTNPLLVDDIKNYLNKNESKINIKNEKGQTPLMLSCVFSNINIVDLLIRNGADINIKDNNEYTALMYTCSSRNSLNSNNDIVKLLLQNKADIDSKNINGETALMLLCYFNKYTPCDKTIEILLKNGADVNIKNIYDETVLMKIIKYKPVIDNININSDYKVIKLIIKNGANINLKDNNGNTALILAALYNENNNNNKIILLLLKNGADLNLKNNNNQTALTISTNINENFEMIEILFTYNLIEKIKQLEINLNMAHREIDYYKTSLKLHPDGEYILKLKEDFIKKQNTRLNNYSNY